MKKYLLFFIVFLGASMQKGFAQTFPWVDSNPYASISLGTGPVGYAICTDDSDNVFVTGDVSNRMIFTLKKYNSNGVLEWTKAGFTNYAVAADHWGNCYTVGYYFFEKYNSTGTLIHKDSVTGSGVNYFSGNAICYDGGKYFYITGSWDGGGSGSTNFGTKSLITSIDNTNPAMFVLKCDTAGNVLWVKSSYGGKFPGECCGLGINASSNGLIYVTGYFADSIQLSSGEPLYSSLPKTMAFVACYDSGGNVKWAHSTGRYCSASNAVSSDGAGNVYITGNAGSDAGCFIAKYRSNGDSVWWRQCASNNNAVSFGYGIATNSSGISFITGSFEDAPFGSLILKYGGSDNEIYIVEYDSSGNAIWGYDPNDTLPNSVWSSGCAVTTGNKETGDCNFYFTGVTQTPARFSSAVIYGGFYVTELEDGCALGIQNQTQPKETIKVYPNPFTSATTILFSETGRHQLELEDMTGRILQQLVCNGQLYELQRRNLASGMYFIKVTDEQNNVSVSKVLVE